jgi:hypothetical protein
VADEERIPQDITDISSADQLLRYATAGQLEQLMRERSDLSQARIAEAAGLSDSARQKDSAQRKDSVRRNAAASLSRALRNGPTAEQLQKLDRIISPLASNLNGAGGLSSLALRLSAERRDKVRESLTGQVPPGWTGKILKDRPSGELEVLIQASALLSAFMAADEMDRKGGAHTGRSVESIRTRYGEEMDLLVRRLLLIAVAPPTSRNYDAQIMLGSLASYAFEPMKERLDSGVRYSPMAFRVWRAITKLVMLSGDKSHVGDLRMWVRDLIRDSAELRKRSLYAGRSLDLELAITVPAAWSPPGKGGWVDEALYARARDRDATIRERGTAVMGLWERAVREGQDLRETADSLRGLVAEAMSPESRPDASAGLRWIAATLEQAIQEQRPVCNTWPDVDEPWFRNVQRAAAELDDYGIPPHLLTGTKNLFQHMILQNAGVHRRQALETLVTSGYNEPVTRALGFLLKEETEEVWLRIRAEFALGFLQRCDQYVEGVLTRACNDAYANLKLKDIPDDLERIPDDKVPARSRITEMHASLFAVGDCFGAAGTEAQAGRIRENLQPVLTGLADLKGSRALVLRRATRAAAYLLTVTAQDSGHGKDLSQELLERLSSHPDEVTARLSKWALSFRFGPGGKIRPLVDAAEFGKHDDKPYWPT